MKILFTKIFSHKSANIPTFSQIDDDGEIQLESPMKRAKLLEMDNENVTPQKKVCID